MNWSQTWEEASLGAGFWAHIPHCYLYVQRPRSSDGSALTVVILEWKELYENMKGDRETWCIPCGCLCFPISNALRSSCALQAAVQRIRLVVFNALSPRVAWAPLYAARLALTLAHRCCSLVLSWSSSDGSGRWFALKFLGQCLGKLSRDSQVLSIT